MDFADYYMSYLWLFYSFN